MQDSRAGSTLELVVNEQQLQNMSQIDLSGQGNNADQCREEGRFASFEALRSWPGRFRDSLSAKLDEAKAKSDTRAQYALEVARALSGTIIWLLCFVCTIIMPVVLLLVGLLNLDGCTASPSLPYYVFSIGFFMTASNLFNLALALDLPILANHRLLASDIKSIIASILNIVFNSVVAFVYILLAYKVFTFGPRSQSDRDDNATSPSESDPPTTGPLRSNCSDTLFGLAFWFVTLTLGFFGLFSVLGALLFVYNRYRLAIVRGSVPRSHRTDLPGSQTTGANMSPHVGANTATNRL